MVVLKTIFVSTQRIFMKLVLRQESPHYVPGRFADGLAIVKGLKASKSVFLLLDLHAVQ